jgi:hypothetical protein
LHLDAYKLQKFPPPFLQLNKAAFSASLDVEPTPQALTLCPESYAIDPHLLGDVNIF